MKQQERPSAVDLLELHFIENRGRLLELAAYLDRIDRAPDAKLAWKDFRYRHLLKMLELCSRGGERAKTALIALSDPTQAVIPDDLSAPNATGAWRGADAD